MPKSFVEIVPALVANEYTNAFALSTLDSVHAALTGRAGDFRKHYDVTLGLVAEVAALTFAPERFVEPTSPEGLARVIPTLPTPSTWTHKGNVDKKITAIKELRSHFGSTYLGLKQSKDAIEAYVATLPDAPAPVPLSRTVDAIVFHTRALAAERPTHVYERDQYGACRHVHRDDAGQVLPGEGCLVGEAAVRAGFTYDECDVSGGVYSLFSRLGLLRLIDEDGEPDTRDQRFQWLRETQSAQDDSLPWAAAVAKADAEYPLS